MIKAVAFDFDGLILDTELPVFRAWREVFEAYGHRLTLEDWVDYIGRSPDAFDPCSRLENLLKKPIDCDAIRKDHHLREAKLIEAQAALPGVVDMIQQAREHGLMVGIASSSERSWVIRHLDRLGLRDFFHTLSCSDDVVQTKPAPDLYLALLSALGIAPDEAFAIEDSPHGVSSAKAAGIFCVAVPNEMTGALCFAHADLILPSLAGVDLQEIFDVIYRDSARTQ